MKRQISYNEEELEKTVRGMHDVIIRLTSHHLPLLLERTREANCVDGDMWIDDITREIGKLRSLLFLFHVKETDNTFLSIDTIEKKLWEIKIKRKQDKL